MQTLEIIGTLVGLLYLYFEYRASIWLWATSIVMPAIYIFVYYDAGFYADMGINVYYLIASGYGWALWMRRSQRWRQTNPEPLPKGKIEATTPSATPEHVGKRMPRAKSRTGDTPNSEARPISRTPNRRWLPLACVFLVTFAAIAYVLIHWTDSTVPWGDSFTTAMSIVGMWMLAQKYVEQWLVWIAVDAVCAGLYLYKGLYPTAGLYALYTVIAVFGYFKWLRLMKKQDAYA